MEQQRGLLAVYADLVNARGAVSWKNGPFRVVFKRSSEPHRWSDEECNQFRYLCSAEPRLRNSFMKAVGEGKSKVVQFWKEKKLDTNIDLKPTAFSVLCTHLDDQEKRPMVSYGSATILVSEDCFEEATGRHTNLLSSFCLSTGDYEIESKVHEIGPTFVNTLTWALHGDVAGGVDVDFSLFKPRGVEFDMRVLGSQAKSCQLAMHSLRRSIAPSAQSVFMYVLFLDTNGLHLPKMKMIPPNLQSKVQRYLHTFGFNESNGSWMSDEPIFVLLTSDGPVHYWARNQILRFMGRILTKVEEERKIVPRPIVRKEQLTDGSLDVSKEGSLANVIEKFEKQLDQVKRLIISDHTDKRWKDHLNLFPNLEELDASGTSTVLPTAHSLCELLQTFPKIRNIIAIEMSSLKVSEVDGSFLDALFQNGCLSKVIWLSQALFECTDLWSKIFPPSDKHLMEQVNEAHKIYYYSSTK